MASYGLGVLAAEPAVDPSILLKIGEVEVSRYAFEKNLRRALPSASQTGLAALATAEGKTWLAYFLAQQVITAEAIAGGYRDRGEVRHTVDAMERYMLSKPDGPFYQTFYAGCAPSADRLRTAYDRLKRVPDVVVLRLPPAEFLRLSGGAWKDLSPDARSTFLQQAQVDRNHTIHRGALPWPYHPLDQLEEEIAAAAAGSWIVHPEKERTTIVHVKSIIEGETPPFERMRGSLEEMLRRRAEDAIWTKRRREKLAEAEFALDVAAAAQALQKLSNLDRSVIVIPAEAMAACANDRLATYRGETGTCSITVAAWREYYNQLFVKALPGSLQAMEESLADLVMTEIDCREARKLGIDRTPRFVEDRRNFSYYQALDLFEKERLSPALTVSDEEIKSYYRANLADYQRTTRAVCLLLHFASEKEATAWIARREKPAPSPEGRWTLETHEIFQDHPIPLLPDLTNALLASLDGTTLGPFPSSSGFLVVHKQSSTLEQQTVGAMANEIRLKILRVKLINEELRLARDWSHRFQVDDLIPYHAWGLADWNEAPWSAK